MRESRRLKIPDRALSALATLFTLSALFASPQAAHARRYRARRPTRTVTRMAARSTAPAVQPVRSVILFVANGYDADDWRAARAAKSDGVLAKDRMPVTGVALLPEPLGNDTSASLAALLGEGGPLAQAASTAAPEPVMAYAKRDGRSLGLVGAASIADPLPAALAVAPSDRAGDNDADTLRRLALARVDVLFGRSAPADVQPPLETYGYHVLTDPEALLMAEATPVEAAVSADAVPYDTLVFRAMHLLAKNGRGFMIGAGADPRRVPAAQLDAAIAAAVRFARTDGRTLVLLVDRSGPGPATVYAEGASASKFTGTLAAADIPKVLAGVMGLHDFRRDFSPFFAARSQGGAGSRADAPARTALDTRGGLSLPW